MADETTDDNDDGNGDEQDDQQLERATRTNPRFVRGEGKPPGGPVDFSDAQSSDWIALNRKEERFRERKRDEGWSKERIERKLAELRGDETAANDE